MRPPIFAAALGWALALPACVGGPGEADQRSLAVVDGELDPGDPAVVELVGGTVLCTATLVASSAVVTAAHCFEGGAPPFVAFGDPANGDGELREIVGVRRHPDYEPRGRAHDVAVALLGAPAPRQAVPVERSSEAFDASFLDRAVRVVGFGAAGPDAVGDKRHGFAAITGYTDETFLVGPGPSLPCFGDSGGPAFLEVDGRERLVGIVSEGDPGCEEHARLARVDQYALFLTESLDTDAPPADHEPSRADGERCGDDGDCRSGSCARPAAGVEAICAARCFPTNEPACPGTLECRTNFDRPTRSACFPGVGGLSAGCAQAGPPGGSGALALFAAVAVLAALRRNRACGATGTCRCRPRPATPEVVRVFRVRRARQSRHGT